MLGYGMAKAATHQLVRSLAFEDGFVANFSGVAFKCHVNAILPGVLDTKTNRDGMPDADTSSWTSLDDVATQVFKWADAESERPPNGALVEISTIEGRTSFKPII